MGKFLSAYGYSYFFTRIRKIQRKCLSVYGEYGEFSAVNKIVSEYAERIYATWRKRQETQNRAYLS
jgi:hypothetical protein